MRKSLKQEYLKLNAVASVLKNTKVNNKLGYTNSWSMWATSGLLVTSLIISLFFLARKDEDVLSKSR